MKRERLAVERAFGEVALHFAGRTMRLHREPQGCGMKRGVQADGVEHRSIQAERFVEIMREVLARAREREVRVVGARSRAVVRIDHREIEIAGAPSLHEIGRRAGELATSPHRASDQGERPVVGAHALSELGTRAGMVARQRRKIAEIEALDGRPRRRQEVAGRRALATLAGHASPHGVEAFSFGRGERTYSGRADVVVLPVHERRRFPRARGHDEGDHRRDQHDLSFHDPALQGARYPLERRAVDRKRP